MRSWRWSTIPTGLAFAMVAIAAVVIALLPQLVAIAMTEPAALSERERRLTPVALLGLWGQADPTAVTGAAVHPIVHWVLVAVVLVLMVGLTVLAMLGAGRRRKDPQRKDGLAPASKVREELGERQLVKVRGPHLRPGLARSGIRPVDVGYRVGSFWGLDLWLRAEDPTVVIGPSRSGKGWYLVLGWILSAPGAVITTTSKFDNVLMTLRERERRGSTCWIFAPGIEGGEDLEHVLRWDPVEGCIDEATLVRRIRALIPSDAFSGSTSNGGHWDTLGQQLAAHLFHAAACGGYGVDKIWEWVGSPTRALDAVALIREHPQGLLDHAAHLETVISMPPEQRASQWGVLPTALAFMDSGEARRWMRPAEGERIDLVDFVIGRGTLYLVGDKQTTKGYVRIIDGLLAELDYVTKGLADASPGARLDPPVTYLLDEAGNFEYQGLYELITAGGGRGRVAIAVFQSREQLDQWGDSQGRTMWDAAVAKIVLPGGGDDEALRKLSNLIGDLWVRRESHSFGSGPASVQVSEERRAVLEVSEMRELEGGHGILFYRNLKPVIARLTPFSDHPTFAACVADQAQLTAKLAGGSPFAARLAEYRRADGA